MTLREYYANRKNIRQNARTNLKLNQPVKADEHAYAQAKSVERDNKLWAKLIKKTKKQDK